MKKVLLLVFVLLIALLVFMLKEPVATGEAIDLGLSVKWASYNVGATSPEEYGNYYAWGELRSKKSFVESNYLYYNNDSYTSIGDDISGTKYDVATVKWGKSWHMPTSAEMNELKKLCTWEWTAVNDVFGYRITGPNGNSIFLPAAGYLDGQEIVNDGSYGVYWSASSHSSDNASVWNFDSDSNDSNNSKRYYGLPVRPVYRDATDAIKYCVTVSNDGSGSVSINGENGTSAIFVEGSSATIIATPGCVQEFDGWYSDGGATLASTDSAYTFTVSSNVELVAKFNTIVTEGLSIDLGLSVEWASYNVGASSPEECGIYYAWGEKSGSSEYSLKYYKYNSGRIEDGWKTLNKYCTNGSFGRVDYKTSLENSDDVAEEEWGASWRIPTPAEQEELCNNCTWVWTTYNGVNGYHITGPNGNSIFLPAAGYRYSSEKFNSGSCGRYWSRSLYCGNDDMSAYALCFDSARFSLNPCLRFHGLLIRPVCYNEADTTSCNVSVSSYREGVASIDGASCTTAIFVEGSSVTVSATPRNNEEFIGWYSDGGTTLVSTEASYTFIVSNDVELFAKIKSEIRAVDLGLPSGIKWASHNLGAASPEECGDYYAWGETEEKSNYAWSTYKHCKGSRNSITKYNFSGWTHYNDVDRKDTLLEPDDDVAHVQLGGSWRMPTVMEMRELKEECEWTWIILNGVKGAYVTGPNGKSIFLPITGYRDEAEICDKDVDGCYWTSTLFKSGVGLSNSFYFYKIGSGTGVSRELNTRVRCFGLAVRPVCE